jgi:3-hydroxyisobutyrate dehydrogenase
MSTKTSVAVLGLGLMGTGMAGRLLGHGFEVTVYNRSPEKAEPLRSLGAKVASTPKEAATGAMFILSMLTDDIAARAVWLGETGALAGAAKGATLIECSTITVDWIKELSAAAAKQGCDLLDAPVSGTKPHAAAGELNFLVGGSTSAMEHARPLFEAMGKSITHLGPAGSGALMKLINNYVCGVQAIALAEAVAAIERSHLDRDKAVAILTGGAPGSPLVKMISARMISKSYEPNFMLRTMTKDLRYAHHQCGTTEVGTGAIHTFERAIEAGLGDKDFSSVIELLRDNSRKQ